MNRMIRILPVLMLILFLFDGCGRMTPGEPEPTESSTFTASTPSANTDAAPEDGESTQPPETNTQEENVMKITIGEYSFTVLLEENETAKKLREQLPLTLSMSELNGNEKYHYLSFTLPADSYAPGEIKAGDVMLYGNNCLVVFYESFSSGYRYTKIGHIENIENLKRAVGSGDIQMTFET